MEHLFSQCKILYRKYTHSVKGIYRKKGIRPGTDWKVIVVTFFVGVVLVAIINLFIYMQVKNNVWWAIDDVYTGGQVKIDQKILTDVLYRFEQQEKKLKEFKLRTTVANDPSL